MQNPKRVSDVSWRSWGEKHFICYNTRFGFTKRNAAAEAGVPSTSKKCGENPEQYGVNQTALWKCSMYSEGSLAEQCANDLSRFYLKQTSECSHFIPPTIDSLIAHLNQQD